MAASISNFSARRNRRRPTTEPLFVRWLLITVALLFLEFFSSSRSSPCS